MKPNSKASSVSQNLRNVLNASSAGSTHSLTTTIHDILPSTSPGARPPSSRPSSSLASGPNDLTTVDVELVEQEATTIGDAGLSTDDFDARRQRLRSAAIDDSALSMQDRWRLSNVLRGAMAFNELTTFSSSLHSAKSITLLLLSTFSDFQAERHYLHTEVFPDLRDQLRGDGQIELNVLDIWLGVEDENNLTSLDWHNFANFLIGQGKTGTPLICIILSGHKYGQPIIAPVFEDDGINILTEFCSSDATSTQLLSDALWPDIGQMPQDIVDQASLAQVAPERRRFILRQETLGASQLHALSYLIASASTKRPELESFVSSGPELLFEVLTGHFNPSDISLIVFSRRITGLRDNTHLPICRQYCDSELDSPAEFCNIRLKRFQDKLCRLTPEIANRLNLELKISDLNGVNCERHGKFSKILADGGRLIYHALKDCDIIRMIRNRSPLACVSITESKVTQAEMMNNALDTIVREATIHLMYAHQHATGCVGRDKVLGEILAYVTNHENNSTTFGKPLAIVGPVGCGQSTLLSAAVLHLIERAFPGDSTLVCMPRFANLTPDSSELKPILRGMLLHLTYVVGGATRANRELESPDDISSIKNRFIHELQTLSQSVRVVFILDGLESLRSAGGSSSAGFGDFIDWLPSVLSERVRVVVGLKKENDEAVTHFSARYGPGCVLNIEDFSPFEANELLKKAVLSNGQQLMFSQWQALRKAMDSIAEQNNKGVPAPYLSLIREAALRWHSFTAVSPDYFGFSIEGELSRIFSLYEMRNGLTFTRHTLAYLTAAENHGLSLAELGDILSLDNFVLHALGTGERGTGPMTGGNEAAAPSFLLTSGRVPTLALYRLLFEVNPFLAQRTVDSLAVIVWADGLVAKFAQHRYLQADPDLARMVNSNMAEYYLGSWAGKTPRDLRLSVCENGSMKDQKSPAANSKSSHNIFAAGKAIRYVVRQPLAFSSCRTPAAAEANVRRLSCLPFYLLAAGRYKDLCVNILFNLEWLMTKISALGVDKTLTDFHDAITVIRHSVLISPVGSDEIAVVRDAIKFSRSILSIRPYYLPGLLLARLLAFQHSARLSALHKNICSLLTQCDRMSATDWRCSLLPVMSCLDTPGSPLIYTARLVRKSPMTIVTSPLHVVPVQTTYAFVLGLKLDASRSARFWVGCGCGSLGPSWFCPPIRHLPQGPIFKLNTPGGRLCAVISERQTLKVYHVESGELVYSVNLQQQVEVKQLVSSDRFIVIIPGLTALSTINNNSVDRRAISPQPPSPVPNGLIENSRPTSSSGQQGGSQLSQAAVTQPTGPIVIDMLHQAIAHRFHQRPDYAAISSENDVFAFCVCEEVFIYQFPLMECIHSFRTDMPPNFMHIVPQSVHGRSDDIRVLVVTNHGSVVMAIVKKKVSKSIMKPVLPYRESLVNPVVQIDTVRGGIMGLVESPAKLFLLGLRDGSLLEEFNAPAQVPAPRRFTAAAFACFDQMIASSLDTGHICLFRIGDTSSVRIINPLHQSLSPFVGQVITHMYGPTCCWRVMALSTDGQSTFLRCWDVSRLSSLSHITNHSHIVAPGKIIGLFPPVPYVDGPGENAGPMAIAVLSSPTSHNTKPSSLQIYDLRSRSVGIVPLDNFEKTQRVARIVVSPDASFCLVIDTDRRGFLYTACDNNGETSDSYNLLGSWDNITDAFFTSPSIEGGHLFETIIVLITNDRFIQTYRLGYGPAELLREISTRSIRDPVFLPELRSLCFLTTEANQHRSTEDIKVAIINDVTGIDDDSTMKTFQLYEVWKIEGNAHWELSRLWPIESAPSQLLIFFTVSELSSALYPSLSQDHVGCFAYDVNLQKMIWSSMGSAAFIPHSPVTPETLFLPTDRMPFLHVDSRAKLACDVDLGTVYDLQFGCRAKISLSVPCCIESVRYLLRGEYFCALTPDRRKVFVARSNDEQIAAEFELFGLADCLEVISCRNANTNRRVVVIGMEDGRIVALSFVADLCDPTFEHIVQFRKPL